MRRLFFTLFFLSFFFAKAQNADSGRVIGIHPAVGKSISREEKIRYALFPEYKDSLFESAEIIKYNDSTFMLHVRAVQGTEITTKVSTRELDDLFYDIEKVEKSKKEKDEYVLTEEERKEIRRKRAKEESANFWTDFLVNMTIITFETLLTITFSN